MSYDKAYAGGWQDGQSGQTPINAAALNHMEEGIESASAQMKWQSFVSDGITLAADEGMTYTVSNVTMPPLDGYSRFVIPRSSRSQVTVTGWAFDSDNHLTVFIRNLTSSSTSLTVRGMLFYLSEDNQWT